MSNSEFAFTLYPFSLLSLDLFFLSRLLCDRSG